MNTSWTIGLGNVLPLHWHGFSFPSLSVSSGTHISFIKPTKSCQQRADNTSKTAVRPVTTISHTVPVVCGPTLRVYASHRHGIQCARSTTSRRTQYINPRQDHKNDMPNIALWSSPPLIPRSLCRLLTLHVFQAYICVLFPSWFASWCKRFVTKSA